MIFNILSKILDIPILVSPQKSSNPTRQSPVLVPATSQPSSATPLYCPVFQSKLNHLVISDASQYTLWQPQEFHVWRYPTFLPAPLGCWAIKTDLRLSLHTHEHMTRSSVSQDGTHCDQILISFWTWHEDIECCNNKPVVDCKELDNPENPAVLEDLPMSTNEYMINLFSYLSSIAIPSPAVQLLVSDTKNLQFSIFWILQNSGDSRWCSWYQSHWDQHITRRQRSQWQWQHWNSPRQWVGPGRGTDPEQSQVKRRTSLI